MRKKILIYMENLAGGGAERTVINIINNIDHNKFEIVLVVASDSRNDYLHLVNELTKIIILKTKSRTHTIINLAKMIRKETPDLLFTTMNNNNLVLLLAKLFSLTRIPVVIREANNRTQSGKVTFKNRLATTILYNLLAKKIIALSNGVMNDLVLNFSIKENKTVVIYNPIDINMIDSLKHEEVTDICDIADQNIIISVGKLGEQKDFPTLLRAFEIVQKNTKSRLLILGKGAEEDCLRKLSKDLCIDDNVDFVGFKKNPYKYINIADILILSSKWEGFGHVIVEAMAIGTPVIATDCNSGPREIIGDNKYGVLVPVGDYESLANETMNLLNNGISRKKYEELGIKRSQDFNVKKIVLQYEKLFLDVVEKTS